MFKFMLKSTFYVFLLAFVIFFNSAGLFAFEIDGFEFDLEAESILYDEATSSIIASENVSIQINEVLIFSDHFKYDAKEKDILFLGNVTLIYGDYSVAAFKLRYNLNDNVGVANSVRTASGKTSIFAKSLSLDSNKMTFFDVMITSCDLDKRHYSFLTESIEFNRNRTDALAKNLDFEFYGRKIFNLSSYRFNKDSDDSNQFIPKIGSNRVDGNYLYLYLPYTLTPKFDGNFRLGFSEKEAFLQVPMLYIF